MADLISSWSHKIEALPQNYVLPLNERPAETVPIVKDFPVIDLGKAKGQERPIVIQQLNKAWQHWGFFQVINHGVAEELMDDAMKVSQEVFSLPVEEKESYAKGAKLYTSSSKYIATETIRYWRDVLEHGCNDEEDKKTWPDNPPRYREVIGSYSAEMKKLSKTILGLIGEGIGLEAGHFDKQRLKQKMLINHYPACPDPKSTLGVGGHCDPNLMTFIQQQVYGLQIMKDGKWIGVEPIPHAFVVNSGLPMTVISNGKLASVAHRVVTNTSQARTSIGTFFDPPAVIEPAKSLVCPGNPPLYKSFKWIEEFMPHYLAKSVLHASLESFKIDA